MAGLASTLESWQCKVLKVKGNNPDSGENLGHTSVGYAVEEGALHITAEHLPVDGWGTPRGTDRAEQDPGWEPEEMLWIPWGKDLEFTYISHS